MPLAMLLLSVLVAAVSGVAVWTLAGFWWALVAYSAAGAVTLLALAATLPFPAPREAGRQFSRSRIAG